MINALCSQTPKKPNIFETELKEICARYTTDIIASTFFGIQSNCIKDDKSEFRFYGRKIFEYDAFRGLQIASLFFMPEAVPYLRIKVSQQLRFLGHYHLLVFQLFPRDTERLLRTTIREVIAAREASGEKRGDLIDTLIYLKKTNATLGEGSELGELI
jgi:cytochrome P450 family 6